MWIHDEPLPSDGRAGFFEIDPHDNFDPIRYFVCERFELFGVFESGFGIVNRARSDHSENPPIISEDNLFNGVSGVRDKLSG